MSTNNLKYFHDDITISGKDVILITLDERTPMSVSVYYKQSHKRHHHHHHVPCDNHKDSLDWGLYHNGIYILEINWDVSGTKEIIWQVFY